MRSGGRFLEEAAGVDAELLPKLAALQLHEDVRCGMCSHFRTMDPVLDGASVLQFDGDHERIPGMRTQETAAGGVHCALFSLCRQACRAYK